MKPWEKYAQDGPWKKYQGERPGAMAFVNKGIARTVGGIVDFVNPFDAQTGSAVSGLENLMESAGINVADVEPEGVAENFALGTGDAAGALIPSTLVAKGLSMAPGMLGRIGSDASRAMSSGAGAAGEVAAGGVSRAAEGAAEAAGAPEWVQDTVAVAAPVGALAGASVATRQATNLAQRTPAGVMLRQGQAAVAPFTRSGATEVARQRLQSLAGGPERAAQMADNIGGENPLNLTPAQQTGDPNMLGLERLASQESVAVREELARRAGGAQERAGTLIAEQGGNPADTQAFFAQRRDQYIEALQNQADSTVARADDRVGGITGQNDEITNSRQTVEAVESGLADALVEEKRLWDLVDKNEAVPTTNAKARAASWAEELGRARAGNMPNLARSLLLDEGGYGDTETVRELHGLYSELRETARNAMAGNNQQKTLAKVSNEIADAILEDLGAKAGTTPVGAQINEARAYSAALHEVFDRGAPGSVLKRTIDGDTRVEPEEALGRTVGRGGVPGEVDAAQLTEAGGARAQAAIGDYLAGQFSRAAFKATGEFTNAGAARFIRDNKYLLDRYPELRDEIRGAVGQKESADQLSDRITQRIAQINSERENGVAAFLGAEPEVALDALFKAKNPARAALQASREARKDKTGAALAGLKGAVSQHLIRQATTTTRAQTRLSGNALAKLLDDPANKRVLSGILSPAEMGRFRRLASELAKVENASANAANVGDSLSGATGNRVIEFFLRFQAVKNAPGAGGVRDLQTSQMISSRVRDAWRSLGGDKASKMIEDAIIDPELFRALLIERGTPKSMEDSVPYLIPYLIGSSATAVQE